MILPRVFQEISRQNRSLLPLVSNIDLQANPNTDLLDYQDVDISTHAIEKPIAEPECIDPSDGPASCFMVPEMPTIKEELQVISEIESPQNKPSPEELLTFHAPPSLQQSDTDSM